MAIKYYQREIAKTLERNNLVGKLGSQIYYKPEKAGESYRKKRKWLMRNSSNLMLTGMGLGVLGIGATAYFNPEAVKEVSIGVGAAGVAGALARAGASVDNILYGNPKDVAIRYFKKVDVNWNEAYNSLKITNKKELDGYVCMAQAPGAVKDAFPTHDNQVTLGITIGSLADKLSGITFDNLKGVNQELLIDMISKQKIGTPQETEIIKQLTENNSTRKLVSKIRKKDFESFEGLDVLANYLNNFELSLRISEADDVEAVGSQLSKGNLFITNAVGPDAGCYMGVHSGRLDFPRMRIGDDVGHSLMTHATKGMALVGGNAQQGVLEGATGGIAIIEGYAEHNFARGMTDTTWPAIAITEGGLKEELVQGQIRNGLVISLNKSNILPGDPMAYHFENGRLLAQENLNHGRFLEEGVIENVDKYVSNWVKEKRPVA